MELSIIIPCYNQGRFLNESITSCLRLQIADLEVIIINDGSTDDTEKIALTFPGIRYYSGPNRGLASARNKGIRLAKGNFISFLDADDVFLPTGLQQALEMLRSKPNLAFLSGCHLIVNKDRSEMIHCFSDVSQPYCQLLESNFIGNPSCVVYRRNTLTDFPFDENPSILGCEDYDQYLRITRERETAHFPLMISKYVRHEGNMSNNRARMLLSALTVLERHKIHLRSKEEQDAWERGWWNWCSYYNYLPLDRIGKRINVADTLKLFAKYKFRLPLIIAKKISSH